MFIYEQMVKIHIVCEINLWPFNVDHLKNMIIFGADMCSFLLIENEIKDALILGKGPTQGLDDTRLIAEKEYSIKFTEQLNKFCISLYYNGVNSLYLLMVLNYINSKQRVLK